MPSAFPHSQKMWSTISSRTVLSFHVVYDGVPRPRPSFRSGSQSGQSCPVHVLGPIQMGTKNRVLTVHHSSLLGLPIHPTCSTGIAADILKEDQMDYGWSFAGLGNSLDIGWSFALHLGALARWASSPLAHPPKSLRLQTMSSTDSTAGR